MWAVLLMVGLVLGYLGAAIVIARGLIVGDQDRAERFVGDDDSIRVVGQGDESLTTDALRAQARELGLDERYVAAMLREHYTHAEIKAKLPELAEKLSDEEKQPG